MHSRGKSLFEKLFVPHGMAESKESKGEGEERRRTFGRRMEGSPDEWEILTPNLNYYVRIAENYYT